MFTIYVPETDGREGRERNRIEGGEKTGEGKEKDQGKMMEFTVSGQFLASAAQSDEAAHKSKPNVRPL